MLTDAFSRPLGEYVCLQLVRILENEERDEPVPFVLRRLVSRQYHIGPEGIVIGTASDCTASLPKVSRVWGKHLGIRWVPGAPHTQRTPAGYVRRGSKLMRQEHVAEGGCFVLEDLTNGGGTFYISHDSPNLQQAFILEQEQSESDENSPRPSILSPDSSIELEMDHSGDSTRSLGVSAALSGASPSAYEAGVGQGSERVRSKSYQRDRGIHHPLEQRVRSKSEERVQARSNQSDEGTQLRAQSLQPVEEIQQKPDQPVERVQQVIPEEDTGVHLTVLSHGIKFVTGNVEWSITALPPERVLVLRMFAAARKGNLEELRTILDSSICANLTVPYVFVSGPADSGKSLFTHGHHSTYRFEPYI